MTKQYTSVEEILSSPTAERYNDLDKGKVRDKMGLEDKTDQKYNFSRSSPTSDFFSGLYYGTKGAILWNMDTALRGLKGFTTNPAEMPKRRDYTKETLENLNRSTASSWGYGIGNMVTGNPFAWTLIYIAYDKLSK